MQRLSLGEIEIGYMDRGEGEPLMLVHAGLFADWFRPLSESPTLDGFRVVRVRRAGYGPTAPTGHVTISDHASHVAALVDRLGLRQIHWVGHSSSCHMGLQLALDRPDLIRSLVLLEPAAGGGFAVPATEELGLRFVRPALEAYANGYLQQAFDIFMRGVCGDGYQAVIERQLGRDAYEGAVRDCGFFFRDEIAAVLEWEFGTEQRKRIYQPTLLVEGDESRHLGPLSRQVTERAAALLPHARTVVLDGVNHLLPLQDPRAVARVIANFVREYPVAATVAE